MSQNNRYYDSQYTIKGDRGDIEVQAKVFDGDDYATVMFRDMDGDVVHFEMDERMLNSLSGHLAVIRNAIMRGGIIIG